MRSTIPPSPCARCARQCRNEPCLAWRSWYRAAWATLRALFGLASHKSDTQEDAP